MHRTRQNLQAGVRVAQQLVNEDESDIPDQNKCRVLEDRKFFDEPNTRSRHEPEGKNPNEDTGADNPELRTHSDGGNDIIHAQAEIHDFNGGDRPEESTLGDFGNVRALGILRASEMIAHEVNQIRRATDFQPGIFDDPCGEGEAEPTKEIGADDTEFEGEIFLAPWQVVRHCGNGECIIHAQQTLDNDQRNNDRQRLDERRRGWEGYVCNDFVERGQHGSTLAIREIEPIKKLRRSGDCRGIACFQATTITYNRAV